jgi:lysyl-tRNA synthetase class 2
VSDLDENKLIAERKSKLALLREAGNPYVNDFKPLNLALDIHSKFDENSNEELQDIKESVTIAGRIMLKRIMGKASFVQLQDTSGQIQLFVTEMSLKMVFIMNSLRSGILVTLLAPLVLSLKRRQANSLSE